MMELVHHKLVGVDVVIGTHRLLSKDVKFHDLGLLIVDEEQRFGVAHKERLKEMRKNVDALALSATPIPRTLALTAYGDMDVSRLLGRPPGRKKVETRILYGVIDRLLSQVPEIATEVFAEPGHADSHYSHLLH